MIKMKAQFETDIFLSEGGYVSILQKGALEDDQLIILSLEQVKVLAAELGEYAENGAWWSDREDE